MTALLEKLFKRHEERQQTAEEAYTELAISAAKGKEFDPQKAETIVDAAGETLKSLKKRVTTVKSRHSANDARSREQKAIQTQQELAAKEEALNEEIRETKDKWSRRRAKIQAEMDETRRVRQAADQATRLLYETCPGWIDEDCASLRATRKQVDQRVTYNVEQERLLLAQLEGAEEELARYATSLKTHGDGTPVGPANRDRKSQAQSRHQSLLQEIDRLKSGLSDVRSFLNEARPQLDQIDNDLSDLEAKKLELWPIR